MEKSITYLSVYVMGEITSYDKMEEVLKNGFEKVSWVSNSISFICDDELIHVKTGNGFTKFGISVATTRNIKDILYKVDKIINKFMAFVIYYDNNKVIDIDITKNQEYMNFIGNLFIELNKENFELDDIAKFIAFAYKKREVLKSIL